MASYIKCIKGEAEGVVCATTEGIWHGLSYFVKCKHDT